MNTQRNTIDETAIRDAVLELYLAKRLSFTSDEIAQHLGCSASTVRRITRKNGGAVKGTVCHSYDRTMRWLPDRRFMADKLLEALAGAAR